MGHLLVRHKQHHSDLASQSSSCKFLHTAAMVVRLQSERPALTGYTVISRLTPLHPAVASRSP